MKKLLVVLLLVTVLLMPGRVACASEFLRGDANEDGVVNIVDSLFIKQALVGQRCLSGQGYINAASVSTTLGGHISLSITDALIIEQWLAGQISEFPPQEQAPVFGKADFGWAQ